MIKLLLDLPVHVHWSSQPAVVACCSYVLCVPSLQP